LFGFYNFPAFIYGAVIAGHFQESFKIIQQNPLEGIDEIII